MTTPLRLLLVEDSHDILFLLKTELEWLGYSIEVALDGFSGLSLAKAILPDVIVSDIQMPGMDGFEFVRLVRKTPELATVPVIALSGFGLDERLERSLGHAFSAYLTKPVEAADIANLAQQLTEPKRRRIAI